MLRTDYVPLEPLPAQDLNDIVGAILNGQANVTNILLELYYEGIFPSSIGIFFDGFGDATKINDDNSAINSACSSGQANVTVVSGAVFLAGQEVDVFDTSNGKIETKIIQSIATNVLTMTTNFAYSYTTAGFVTRSSVDLDTGAKTIAVQPELSFGVYRSNKVEYQQDVQQVRTRVTRKLETGLNRFALLTDVAVSATTLEITGDVTPYFLNGDTIDILNGTNTVRERKTISGSPSFGSGKTTITITPAIVNASGFDNANALIERVDILPKVSLVDSGDDEDFQSPTYLSSIVDFDNDEVEDAYEYDAGSAMHDFILKLTLN